MQKRFASFVAVGRASFEVAPGEFFSVLGPSGCGKTTILRMIGGFEDVTSGRIRLDGVDVRGVPPYRRRVNTVFQQYALFPHLDVFDNVAFGPRMAGIKQADVTARVREMLDVVRLGEFAQRRPEQLSSGQRQRVALARALVNFPRALLLDEPLSALDLTLRQAMHVELKRIQREVGIAFVFITHDQDEALAMSDRIAVMSQGRIEQVGTPEDIYHSPASVFVAGFIGSANLLPARVEGLQHDWARVQLAGGHWVRVPRADGSLAAGSRSVLMLRPERIELAEEAPDAPVCAISVTVADVSFQGPVLRCVVRDDADNQLIAHIRHARRPAGLIRGARRWAIWEPAAGRLLPAEPGNAGTANCGVQRTRPREQNATS
ncbi:MAG: ABC transporter ATP-binding protein [Candidatus Binatia bacterium]